MEPSNNRPRGPALADLDELVELAVTLSARAVEVHRGAGADIRPEHKTSPFDLVTAVDREAERVIVEGILAARPGDGILGEEGASREGRSGVRWIIDPLDGTTNFVYGYPEFAVSLGIEVGGVASVGVVRHSARDQLYIGIRGRGAWMNGVPIRVGDRPELATALFATGFSYDVDLRRRQAEVLVHVLPRTRDMRRGGSAALDLCNVASGVVDLYFECPLGPWDLAAGRVIAEAAGAVVVVGTPPGHSGTGVVAANSGLLPSAIAMLAEAGLDFRASMGTHPSRFGGERGVDRPNVGNAPETHG